jgi:hypothetical protein
LRNPAERTDQQQGGRHIALLGEQYVDQWLSAAALIRILINTRASRAYDVCVRVHPGPGTFFLTRGSPIQPSPYKSVLWIRYLVLEESGTSCGCNAAV